MNKKSDASAPHRTREVAAVAIVSRLLVLSLCWLLDLAFPDYDLSTALAFPDLPRPLKSVLRWDALYFVSASTHGYRHEQNTAFLPGYPLLISGLSAAIAPLLGLTEATATALSAVVISNLCHVVACMLLYQLTRQVFHHSRHLPWLAALVFAFNPASVFFSAAYTESLFSCITFAGMLLWTRGMSWTAALIFAVATIIRSNGVVNAGFFAFEALLHVIRALDQLPNTVNGDDTHHAAGCGAALVSAALSLARAIMVVTPFLAYQVWVQHTFCNAATEHDNGVVCDASVYGVYAAVQRQYWDVGFLHYYRLSQLPNFMLAAPMVLFSARFLHLLGRTLWLQALKALNSTGRYNADLVLALKRLLLQADPAAATTSLALAVAPSENTVLFRAHGMALVFGVQAVFLLAVGLTSMHVQVLTRMFLAASPVASWSLAVAFLSSARTRSVAGVYVTAYLFLGCLLFSNFLPWT